MPKNVPLSGEKVTIDSPRDFLVNLDGVTHVPVKRGRQEVDKVVAEHWYARQHGVRIVDATEDASTQEQSVGDQNQGEAEHATDADHGEGRRRRGR